tara:strand:+ start:109 stop:780 length:672 start_codon:yes stop_codon:yes gene_type:complete
MSTTKVTDALRNVTAVDAAKITTGTIPEARIATLAASKLTGTVADARFPSTLPATSGANLTALPAGNLTGTVADARISALTASKLTGALPAISGANLTNLPGGGADTSLSNLASAGEQRVAHCWIQFGGIGTIAIRDSYNVASITDHATGRYSVTFTSAMPNDDYCVSGGAAHQGSGQAWRRLCFGADGQSVSLPTTSSFMCGTGNYQQLLDCTQIMCVVHGD